MVATNFFFISAGIGIWFIMIVSVLIVYKIVKLINTTEIEIKSIKNSLKLTGLNLISKILGPANGGDNSGKEKK